MKNQKLKFMAGLLMAALFAFVGSAMILGGIDSYTAFSEAPTHLSKFIPHLTGMAVSLSLLGALSPGMVYNSPLLTGMTTFAGKYSKQLLGQLFQGMDNSMVTVDTDATSDKLYPKLTVNGSVVAYSPTFSPSDDLTFSDRKLSPKLAKRELRIEPKKFHNSYASYVTGLAKSGALDRQIPFEQFVWQKVMENINHQIVTKMIGMGDTASGDATKAIQDGFLKQISTEITATNITPVATGAWSSSNAVTKSETLWKGIDAVWQETETIMYMSRAQYIQYLEAYRTQYPYDGAAYSKPDAPALYVPVSGGMCRIVAVPWIVGSNRVFITRPDNLIVGGNFQSEIAQINAVPNVWTIDAGVSFGIGVCIPDLGAIWVNDQA